MNEDLKGEDEKDFLLGYQFCRILNRIDERTQSRFWIDPDNIERVKRAIARRGLEYRVVWGSQEMGKWITDWVEDWVILEVDW